MGARPLTGARHRPQRMRDRAPSRACGDVRASGGQEGSRWAAGPLGRWAAGPLGRWAAGPLGRWAAGPLGRWAAGPLGRWAESTTSRPGEVKRISWPQVPSAGGPAASICGNGIRAENRAATPKNGFSWGWKNFLELAIWGPPPSRGRGADPVPASERACPPRGRALRQQEPARAAARHGTAVRTGSETGIPGRGSATLTLIVAPSPGP